MGKIFDKLTSEMKDKKLYLMAEYFDLFGDSKNFINEVSDLTQNWGGSDEGGYLYCYFPRQLDEGQLTLGGGFDGIEFGLFEDKISVGVPTFRKYLQMACEVYWQENPESKEILQKYLARPQPPLEEGALEEWKRRRDAGEYPKPYSEFDRD